MCANGFLGKRIYTYLNASALELGRVRTDRRSGQRPSKASKHAHKHFSSARECCQRCSAESEEQKCSDRQNEGKMKSDHRSGPNVEWWLDSGQHGKCELRICMDHARYLDIDCYCLAMAACFHVCGWYSSVLCVCVCLMHPQIGTDTVRTG